MLVVTSNYFRRFCDKLQHLLDIPIPSLDACSASCSVDYQRQVYLNFLQVKGRIVVPLSLSLWKHHLWASVLNEGGCFSNTIQHQPYWSKVICRACLEWTVSHLHIQEPLFMSWLVSYVTNKVGDSEISWKPVELKSWLTNLKICFLDRFSFDCLCKPLIFLYRLYIKTTLRLGK